jgi:hypothetical protein
VTFENPWALALLVAVPIAWWIHRSRRGAPVVRVASLLAFRGASTTQPSSAPRAALDWRIALVLAAMTLLAFAAAGPTFGSTRPDAFYVVIDESSSMARRGCDAVPRSGALLRAAAPSAVWEPCSLDGRTIRTSPFPAGQVPFVKPPPPPDGLPESLGTNLEAARAQGFPGIVLVTDAPIEAMPGVALVGPSVGAKTNVAVEGAVLDGVEAVVVLRNHGAADVAVEARSSRYEGPGRAPAHDSDVRQVTVPGRGVGVARFPAPEFGATTEYSIVSPKDDLGEDDTLIAGHVSGVRWAVLARASDRIELALRAAGVAVVRSPVTLEYLSIARGLGPSDPYAGEKLVIAIEAGTRVHGINAVAAKSEIVRGDAVVGRGELADVLPSPGVTLVARTRLVGGTPMWSDAEGVLAATDDGVVVFAVDPDDPRSDWHRDPSFPAAIAAAIERAGGGRNRIVLLYAIPPPESDVVRDPPRTSSAQEIRAVMRPGGPAPEAIHPARWLALVGALLLLVAALVPRR